MTISRKEKTIKDKWHEIVSVREHKQVMGQCTILWMKT